MACTKKERDWQERIDSWRIIPRLLMLLYALSFYQTTTWFQGLEDPNSAQAAFVSTIVGAGAAWFGLFLRSEDDNHRNKPSTHNGQSQHATTAN